MYMLNVHTHTISALLVIVVLQMESILRYLDGQSALGPKSNKVILVE